MLNEKEKQRIEWACRRGMLELDMIFKPFFEAEFNQLSKEEQAIFLELLKCDDPDLFAWLMRYKTPPENFTTMIDKISKWLVK
ncbi:MAG: succinate dehydrogenase assembly factor 2 [Gammaproteobacteria bacterium]